MLFAFLIVFILPVLARATMFAVGKGPTSWRDADWSSAGLLPPANDYPGARVIVFSGRTGSWKGAVAVHSWIVYKRSGDRSWTRHDVVGWGTPVRTNGWAPDGRWYGNRPVIVADVTGAEAETVLPKVEAAIAGYPFRQPGEYRIWPGPNSNTFVASVLRSVPELDATLPSNALGRDYRPRPYVGLTDTRTGVEASLWGLLGLKIGWVEGIELNIGGLVAGLDVRHPGVKLPGYGRVGLSPPTAVATQVTN